MKAPWESRLPRSALWTLIAICGLALIVRIAAGSMLPNIIQQDETFQYQEQAHRLVFGTGLIPWEYIIGTRSWFLPGLLAGVIEIARLFGGSPETTRAAIIIFAAALSLAPVICGYLWGWRAGGQSAAIAAATLNACWFELIYFSSQALSETMAGDALVVGLYLAYPGPGTIPWKRLFMGGVFLGLTVTLRLQLGPAIALGIMTICGTSLRTRYLPIIAGAALPVLLSGLLDAFTWAWPFQSMALNFWINVKEGVATDFGTSPFYQYLGLQVTYWSGAFALIVVLALMGSRRLPALLVVATTIYVTHSFLAHKEYRFTYPALPLLMTLVGIASANLAERLLHVEARRRASISVILGVPVFWIVTSAILSREREFYPLWYRDAGSIEAARLIDQDPSACGVAVYPDYLWHLSFGYSRLRAGIPIYASNDSDTADTGRAFNYLVGYKPADFTGRGFTRLQCWQEPEGRTIHADPICLWHRAGSCDADAAPLLTAMPPAFLLRDHPDWFKPPKN